MNSRRSFSVSRSLMTASLVLALGWSGLLVNAQDPLPRLQPGAGTILGGQPVGPAVVPSRGVDRGDSLPSPRKADSGPLHPRLHGLPAGTLAPIGTTPTPNRQIREKFGQFVESIVDPENTLDVVAGRPRLMRLREAPARVQVADEKMLAWTLVSPREFSLQGMQVGSTVLNLWFGDPNDLTKQTILSYLVHILPDPEAKERLERVYKALEEEINRAFPDAYVCLFLVGDKLVLAGEAKDAAEATKILQVVRANAPAGQNEQNNRTAAHVPVSQINLNLNPADVGPDGRPAQALENYLLQGEANVVNLLRIPGEQQVMLKVTVAEVSRAAARQIGLNFQMRNNAGIQYFAQNTGPISSGSGVNVLSQVGGAVANLPALIDQGQISLAIDALKSIHLARSLAEPNVVALNGHPAFFHVGGQFPVPVVTGATSVGLQGVSFVPYGVQLTFTPYVTDKDRVRLQLNASVSVRDIGTGANFGTGSQTSTFVPGLSNRDVNTTVELREGQTLAIGGLLQTNLGADTDRVPLFGEIPIGGQLFRFDRTSATESELVLLVTPQLVHPMEPQQVPSLPGSDYFEPGDLEFFLYGRLESRRSYDYRSPVMHDLHRMKAYRNCELLYFAGPHGQSDVQP